MYSQTEKLEMNWILIDSIPTNSNYMKWIQFYGAKRAIKNINQITVTWSSKSKINVQKTSYY
jgi:hypothetical protein